MNDKTKKWQAIRREGEIIERHDFEFSKGVVTTFVVEFRDESWACAMLNGEVISLEIIE